MLRVSSLLSAFAFAGAVLGAPAAESSSVFASSASSTFSEVASGTSTASSPAASTSDFIPPAKGFIDLDPNEPLWSEGSPAESAVPIRGNLGASIMGPDNVPVDLQNPDLLAGPSTDHGSVANAKWPFALSHNRLEDGGWARQQNQNSLPIATQMASVNMRLEKYAIRELHWHKTAEWAYVLKGKTQVTAVNADGQNYVATVGPGDLWFFPAGIPHSLQATGDDEEGSEFLLVFDSGAFSEDSTFLLTDWLAHIPAGVIEKNFIHDNSAAFDHIPDEELFIFKGLPTEADGDAPVSPQGTVPDPFTFALSQVEPIGGLNGGSVRVADSTNFKISQTIAVAEVTVEPGHIRELHWHPTQDEWSFFLEGTARITVFAAQSNSRTFSYQPGDIGYVPTAMGHYVENTGTTTLKYLEIFKAPRVEDISLNQWLALTPPNLVKAHLGFDDDTIAKLSKTKPYVIGGKLD